MTATRDPDPKVAGEGHARLRAAGILVTEGVLEPEARRAHRGFFTRLATGRPMVTLKLATSFDGRIATASGESRWITGPLARRLVHAERMRHDLVLVGGGTARADDPDLSVRGMGAVRQPVRCVMSRRLNVPLQGRLIGSVATGPVWAIVDAAPGVVEAEAQALWEAQGGEIVGAASETGRIDPGAALAALGARGITRVFCEGGGALAASLLAAGLVDEIAGFTAGVMLGAEGRPALGALGIDALAEAPRFRLLENRAVGPDVLHRWERLWTATDRGRGPRTPGIFEKRRSCAVSADAGARAGAGTGGAPEGPRGFGLAPMARRSTITSGGQGSPVTGSR